MLDHQPPVPVVCFGRSIHFGKEGNEDESLKQYRSHNELNSDKKNVPVTMRESWLLCLKGKEKEMDKPQRGVQSRDQTPDKRSCAQLLIPE